MGVTRRELMVVGMKSAAAVAASQFVVMDALGQTSSKYDEVFPQLDRFVESYMRTMNAPGMTFVMTDRAGVQRIVAYGFADPESKAKVEPNQLFEIGSITKSFLTLVLLQLRDAGKLDVHRPIVEYLPWLKIDSQFAPITVHHLLTHTSGLPSAPLFLSDPAARHRAAYAPGQHFHYNNMAFVAMGHLVETLSGEPFSIAVRRRVFQPLGMTESEPVITLDIRNRLAKNWWPFLTDRPYPRYGKLSEAPPLVMTDASGSIASTPRDMGLYIQMIANGGRTPKGRLVSEESFALMSTPHIKAEEFGPTASYGYGIAVDTLDGHKVLRHTGGMVSFASALQVDVDAGVGAFASINAMQGYRPNPVVQYAIQLMRAVGEGKSLPTQPELQSATEVSNAAEYAGTYVRNDGAKLSFVAKDNGLFAVTASGQVGPLEQKDSGRFVYPNSIFPLVFGRANSKDEKSPVVEVGWGGDWYINDRYTGPKTFGYPREWDAYVGHYRNESPWDGSFRIVIRKGKLMIDGFIPLELGPDGAFNVRDEEWNTEWIRFYDLVNGKSMRVKLSGDDFWRVNAP
jgi:CubicO group peptidase (beta-lactamase class C family)